mmetsp:Transcript_1132/g.1917  ORF Transcript_1132/g.1917 Transcript_1132/m.1917 type:complete len:154 (-) Transcript_1132:311-772(-)
MSHYDRLILYFDGASRHNPRGPAGCGWVIYKMYDEGPVLFASCQHAIAEGSEFLGYNVSNNQAEYQGLIEGLTYMAESDISCDELYVRGDAQIVIRQMDGEYQVRSPNIRPYYEDAKDALAEIDYEYIIWDHVPRSENDEADFLANEAIENGC